MPRMATRLALALVVGVTGARAAMAQDVTLEVAGDCPGTITIAWAGAEPNRPMAICYGEERGFFIVPTGPCGGTTLGINGATGYLVTTIRTRDGTGEASGEAHENACGGYLQLMVINSTGGQCQTSNVVQVPN